MQVRPALVAEVTSPATRRMSLDEKLEKYRGAALPEYSVGDIEAQEVTAPGLREQRVADDAVDDGKASQPVVARMPGAGGVTILVAAVARCRHARSTAGVHDLRETLR